MPAAIPIEIGSIIAQKYAVERILGEGGMGVVVAARHTQLRQRVAIKFLLPSIVAHPEALARFVREARASVRIQSEHVARVLDVGELENGAPYIVMEYLEGTDLSDVLASATRPPIEAVIEYILQACEAVAEAHSLGIVHRDLKPANLFVARRPDGSPLVKVLDFGISKSLDGADQALTRTTSFIGSPLYSSPEQLLSSRSVDARTDIWALGVILYEACTGQVPFTGQNVMEVASRVMKLDPPPIEVIRPGLPSGLAAVIMRCLEKDVARRFATVGDLARALGRFAPHASVSVDRISRMMPASQVLVSGIADTVSSLQPLPTAPTPPVTPASTQREWDQRVSPGTLRPASSRVGFFAAVAGALIVLASAAVVVARSRHPAAAAVPDVPAASSMPESLAPSPPPSPVAPQAPIAPTSVAPAAPSASVTAPPAATSLVPRPSPAKPRPIVPPPVIAAPVPESAPPPPGAAPAPAAPNPAPRNPLDIKIK